MIEEQQMQGNPYMSPRDMYGSSIVLLTNPENELNKMEMTFKNVRPDKDGNLVSAGTPLMNDYGINSVIGTVQTIVNQITILSNLDDKHISSLMDFLGDTLSRDLMINRVDYGISSFAARDKIYFTALSSAFITMQRAYKEGDKRFWKGSVQEIHTKTDNSGMGKKGLFGNLNPWNK